MRILNVPLSISPWIIPVFALALYVNQGVVFCIWMLAVLLHELCHVAVARFMGAEIAWIKVMPFGCEAGLEGSAGITPSCEIATALAGPACNLLIAMLVALWHQFIGMRADWVRLLLTANLFLCAINLLPALPLDGGRLVRALLLPRIGFTRATRLMASSGLVVAAILAGMFCAGVVMGVINATLIGFALFMALAAWRQFREAAAFVPGRWERRRRDSFLPIRYLAVDAGTPLYEVFRHWSPRRYHVVMVVDSSGRVLGTLDEYALWQGIEHMASNTPVGLLKNFH